MTSPSSDPGSGSGHAVLAGQLVDRISEDADEARRAAERKPSQQGSAQPMRVPGDAVAAERLGARDAGAVEKHHCARHGADEVLVRPGWPALVASAASIEM